MEEHPRHSTPIQTQTEWQTVKRDQATFSCFHSHLPTAVALFKSASNMKIVYTHIENLCQLRHIEN